MKRGSQWIFPDTLFYNFNILKFDFSDFVFEIRFSPNMKNINLLFYDNHLYIIYMRNVIEISTHILLAVFVFGIVGTLATGIIFICAIW